jgi:hypothetical protein
MTSEVTALPPIPDTRQLEEEAAQSKSPPDVNWTVFSPDISRGNLDKGIDHNDSRMSVGWNAASTAANRQTEEMPWTISDPQPVSYSRFHSPKEDEA